MVSFSRAQQGESSERTVVHSRAILDSRNRPPVPFFCSHPRHPLCPGSLGRDPAVVADPEGPVGEVAGSPLVNHQYVIGVSKFLVFDSV